MLWSCQSCYHREVHGWKDQKDHSARTSRAAHPARQRKFNHLPAVSETRNISGVGRKIFYKSNGYIVLEQLVSDLEERKKWKFTALNGRVYVRGSDGLRLWNKVAPNDIRDIVVLDVD